MKKIKISTNKDLDLLVKVEPKESKPKKIYSIRENLGMSLDKFIKKK